MSQHESFANQPGDETAHRDEDADGVPIRQPGVATAQHPAVRRAGAPTGETGGPDGPEPTRYGDWERNGRCTDF